MPLTEQIISSSYRDYYPRLCIYANSFLNDHIKSEDLVQDCFESLIRHKDQLNIRASLPVYLYSMVRNRCLNARRHFYTFIAPEETEADQQPGILNAMIEAETYSELHRCIQELPEKCGEVLKAIYLDGNSNDEASRALHITPSTVRNHKARALSLLREKLHILAHVKFF